MHYIQEMAKKQETVELDESKKEQLLNDALKTIETIIQRGMFRSTHVQQVLYGSNDLFNWHPVWSSVDKIMRGFRGTPYKAFRLALVCKLDKNESIYGCTVVYNPRMTNQVR